MAFISRLYAALAQTGLNSAIVALATEAVKKKNIAKFTEIIKNGAQEVGRIMFPAEIRDFFTALSNMMFGEKDTTDKVTVDGKVNRYHNIMAKFQQTGVINHAAKHQASYCEADGTTFQEAMNIVIEAQEAFSDLPSSLRSRFGNDPAAYLNFVSNEENHPEMERLGLLNRAYAEEDILPSNTGETERISNPEGGTVDPP